MGKNATTTALRIIRAIRKKHKALLESEAEWVKFWAPVQGKTFYHNIATGENTREKHADETKIRDATSIEQAQYVAQEQAARTVVQHGDGSPRQWL